MKTLFSLAAFAAALAFSSPVLAADKDPATIAACQIITPEEASAVMGVPFLEFEARYDDRKTEKVAISICHFKFKSEAGALWDIGFDFASYSDEDGAKAAYQRDTSKPEDPNSSAKTERASVEGLGDEATMVTQTYRSNGVWAYSLLKWRVGSVVYDITIGDGDQNASITPEKLRALADFITTKPLPPVGE